MSLTGSSYCLTPTLSRASVRSVPEAHPLPRAGEGEILWSGGLALLEKALG
jgi:hypothetical protein